MKNYGELDNNLYFVDGYSIDNNQISDDNEMEIMENDFAYYTCFKYCNHKFTESLK